MNIPDWLSVENNKLKEFKYPKVKDKKIDNSDENINGYDYLIKLSVPATPPAQASRRICKVLKNLLKLAYTNFSFRTRDPGDLLAQAPFPGWRDGPGTQRAPAEE